MVIDIIRVLPAALARFNAHRGTAHAAEMAVSGLLALFPLLILLGWLAEFVGHPEVNGFTQRLLFLVWPRSIAEPMIAEAQGVLTAIRGAGIVPAAILAPLLAANGFEALRTGLNNAYGQPQRLPFLRARLQSFTLALVAIAALVCLAFALSKVATLPVRDSQGTIIAMPQGAIFLVPLTGGLVLLAGLFAFHRLLPQNGPSLRAAWPGMALTVLVWAMATYGFAFYAERISGFQTTYGGYTSALLTLVLFLITAASVLLGAELNAVLGSGDRRRSAMR
ncbi:MAG: YihY/virulence factor BrkB family protein [Notoacmeibacter sp.]|nr:YihY/virulence factor BrkB family protein [Notoacmeibacter sp.]